MQVAHAGAHRHVRHHDAAQADGDGGRARIGHAAVEDDRGVGSDARPRAPSRRRRGRRISSSPSTRTAHVHRQLAGARHRAGDVEQRQEVALVVGRAARVEAPPADRRLERRRGPLLQRPRRPARRSGRRSARSAPRDRPRAARRRPAGCRRGCAPARTRRRRRARARAPTAAARSIAAASPPPVETDGIAQPVAQLVEQRAVHAAQTTVAQGRRRARCARAPVASATNNLTESDLDFMMMCIWTLLRRYTPHGTRPLGACARELAADGDEPALRQPLRLADAPRRTRRWIPPMDLVETETQYVLRADLPGLQARMTSRSSSTITS